MINTAKNHHHFINKINVPYSKCSFFLLYFVIIISIIFGFTLAINIILQNKEGPTRKVVYIPKKYFGNGAFIIIDSAPRETKTFSANFHSFGTLITNDSITGIPTKKAAILKQNNNYFIILLLSDGDISFSQLYNAHTREREPNIKIITKINKIITVLLPIQNRGHFPIINKKGNKYTIRVKDHDIEIHLNLEKKMIFHQTGLKSNPEEMVILNNNSIAKKQDSSVLLLNASSITFNDNHLNIGKYRNETISGIFSKNLWIPFKKVSYLPQKPKAQGLTSEFTNPLGGYDNGKGYNWRCNQKLLDNRFRDMNYNMNLFFSEDDIIAVKKDSSIYPSMIGAYRKITKNLSSANEYDAWERACLTSYASFIARFDNNKLLVEWAKSSLMSLNNIVGYDQLLNRASTVWWFCTAFDIISPLLSEDEKKKIRFQLTQHTKPLVQFFNLTATNNWRNRIGFALGIAGLILQKAKWVDIAVNHFDKYLDYAIKDGICYEGNSYLDFGLAYMVTFSYCLSRVDNRFINFFSDSRYQQIIAALIAQQTPTGVYPCFEDCHHDTKLHELIISSGRPMYQLAKKTKDKDLLNLSKMCRWIELNKKTSADYKWLPDAPIYLLEVPDTLTPQPIYLNPWLSNNKKNKYYSYILKAGGISILRNDWSEDGEMFVMSAKNYTQSHTHMDELSFEIWATGKKWLTNPGYPSFGQKFHFLTTKTEASNTLLIDGKGQVNDKGASFTKACLTDEMQVIEADGLLLYKHPGRKILPVLWFFNFFICGCFGISFYIIYKDALSPLYLKRNNYIEKVTNKNKYVSILKLSKAFLTIVPAKDLTYLTSYIKNLIINDHLKNNFSKLRQTYSLTHSIIFGLTCGLAMQLFIKAIQPYFKFYMSQEIYPWLELIYKWFPLLPILLFLIGFVVVRINYFLLDNLQFELGTLLYAPKGLFKEILRLAYADITPMLLLLLVVITTFNTRFNMLMRSLIISNLDPWSFQTYLCSWLTKPIILVMFVLVLKLIFQIFAAKKCGLIFADLTGDKRWLDRGYQLALVPILLKKSFWISLCYVLLFSLLYYSKFVNAEFVTH